VGLKPTSILSSKASDNPPQSNQRGIETIGTKQILNSGMLPQSNQRGIETKQTDPLADGPPKGLNRTSVGLKPIRSGRSGLGVLYASIEPAWD